METKYVTSPIEKSVTEIKLTEDGSVTLPIDMSELDDQLDDGSTLVLDSSMLDVPDMSTRPTGTAKKPKVLDRDAFMSILKNALKSEEITPLQAMELRRRFGISNASFHKKKVDKIKKKRIKALKKASKRKNRYNDSTKGQTKQHYHKKP